MKTTLKFFVILLALVMQASAVCAENNATPVYLYSSRSPKIGNNVGPKKAPARPRLLDMEITLNEEGQCLDLYDTEGSTITYYIYDEDDQEVLSGTISFAAQPNASISLESLGYGLYTLEIVLDGTSYLGEFGIEE